MREGAVMACIAAVGLTTSCEFTTEADPAFGATLTGAQEVPAITTSGTGTWSATLDPETKILTYTLTYSGLGSAATQAHIHGPAAAGAIASVLVDLATDATTGQLLSLDTSGSGSGTINLAATASITTTISGDSLRKLLDSGNAYVNVHTATNGGGEIRGRITRQ